MKINKYWSILAISISVISLELIWTRVFSAEFFYTFGFLILSLAVLGLSLGSLALRAYPRFSNPKRFNLILNITALSAILGPPLIFAVGVDFTKFLNSPGDFIKVFSLIIILSSSFFFAGIALAKLFKDNNQDMPKLYMFDMVGAGLGVLIALFEMDYFQVPVAAPLTALPILIISFYNSNSKQKIYPIIITIMMLFFALFTKDLLEVKVDERAPVLYKHWDSMAKLKIRKYNDMYRGLQTDNSSGSTVIGFDGNYNRPDSMKFDFGINAEYLIKRFPKCTFLALGAGGGKDVLQALLAGAKEVHAVEVNPYINYLLKEGELAKFTGHIYDDPRVIVVSEDARSYVRRFENKFDYIFAQSANTYAALASGAFALAENYIFTTEAFKDYWRALTPNGFLMMEHQTYLPRMVSEVINSLKEMGIEDYKSHFAIYISPQWHREILLLSKAKLTDDIITHAFGDLDSVQLVYPNSGRNHNHILNRIVEEGWENVQSSSGIDLSPATDDRPFIAQLGLWKNFSWKNSDKILPYEFSGFPVSKLIIIVIILTVLIIIIPLNLLPYRKKRTKKLNAASWLYFFAIGMGYMIIEVILIQKYTLFIGTSIYSTITVLLTLLIASGIGSKFSNKIPNYLPFVLIAIWLILDVFVFRNFFYMFGGLKLLPRILITIVLIFPLGFFMGMPFPKGTLKVGDLIDWGFAVNGAASVFGATVIMLFAFEYGFSTCLMIAAGIYLIAYGLFNRIHIKKVKSEK